MLMIIYKIVNIISRTCRTACVLYINLEFSDLLCTFVHVLTNTPQERHLISTISATPRTVPFTVVTKIFRKKDITLTRNCVIRICIQNTLVPPIAGYF